MDEQQATKDGEIGTPAAARPPATDAEEYAPPPPPAPGALWAAPAAPSPATPVSGSPEPGTPAATPPPAEAIGRPAAGGSAAAPVSGSPMRPVSSARPVSSVPGAGAARASVPGVVRPAADVPGVVRPAADDVPARATGTPPVYGSAPRPIGSASVAVPMPGAKSNGSSTGSTDAPGEPVAVQKPDVQEPDAQEPDAQEPDAQEPDAQEPDAQKAGGSPAPAGQPNGPEPVEPEPEKRPGPARPGPAPIPPGQVPAAPTIGNGPGLGNGLPRYTLPSTAASAGLPPAPQSAPRGTPYRGFPSSPENIEMTQPVSAGPSQPTRYGSTPTTPSSPVADAVPQQRGQGTVYSTGGYPAIDMTMPVSDPVENSGSLTGHILAQGWYDAPVDQRRSNLKVVIAMLAVLGLLVAVSLVFVFTAGDAFTDFVGNLTGK